MGGGGGVTIFERARLLCDKSLFRHFTPLGSRFELLLFTNKRSETIHTSGAVPRASFRILGDSRLRGWGGGGGGKRKSLFRVSRESAFLATRGFQEKK